MAAASLALSIVALVVAMAGLGWTVYEWHRSGARLVVKATSFVVMGPGADRWLIAVEVTNSGRTATTVSAVGFKRPKDAGVMIVPDPAVGSERIPKRLEPGESFNWPIAPSDVHEACQREGENYRLLRPYANSGHGLFVGKFDKAGLDVLVHHAVPRVPPLPPA